MDARTFEHTAGLQFERLTFFSDAVFAIAITLLILDVRLPPPRAGVVSVDELLPKLLGFLVSFGVIGIYWLAHHRLFGTLKREDGRLRTLNLVFLASVVFLPFPTSVLAEYPLERPAVIFYAASVALVGVLLIALVFTARRPGLMLAGETRGGTLHFAIRSSAAPTVFLASILLALARPSLVTLSWLLIWPTVRVFDGVGRRLQRRIDAKPSRPNADKPIDVRAQTLAPSQAEG